MSFGKWGFGFGDGGSGGGISSNTWQQLDEFEVGQVDSPMVDGQQVYNNALLAGSTNVRVYASGVALPNFQLSIGGRYVSYIAGYAYLTIVGGVNEQEYIIIDMAK